MDKTKNNLVIIETYLDTYLSEIDIVIINNPFNR